MKLQKKTKTSNTVDLFFQSHSCVEFRIFVIKIRFVTDKSLQNNKANTLNEIITGIVNKKHLKSCLMQS